MASETFRVLFLIENVPYSLDTRVRRQAHALRTAGGSVTVICPGPAGSDGRVRDGVRVYHYPKPSFGGGFAAHIAEYAASLVCHSLLTAWVAVRHGFDVIHVANPPDLLWLVAAPYRLLGKRFIFDHHDLVPELFGVRFGARMPRLQSLMLALERRSVRLANHVISTNETFRRMAIERGGKAPDEVSVVRNGPWLERDFRPAAARSPRARLRPRGDRLPRHHERSGSSRSSAGGGAHRALRGRPERHCLSADRQRRCVPEAAAPARRHETERRSSHAWNAALERRAGSPVRRRHLRSARPADRVQPAPHHEQADGVHGARQGQHRLRHARNALQWWRRSDVPAGRLSPCARPRHSGTGRRSRQTRGAWPPRTAAHRVIVGLGASGAQPH